MRRPFASRAGGAGMREGGGIRAFVPRLRRFAAALAGSLEAGDELLVAVGPRLAEELDSHAPRTRPEIRLFALMRELWNDGLREQVRVPERRGGLFGAISAGGRGGVDMAFARLDEADRELLCLVAAEGLSYAEAGQILGRDEDELRRRVARARLALAVELGLGTGGETA